MQYAQLSASELKKLRTQLRNSFEEYKEKGLFLDMSRGKPSTKQLDLCTPMLDSINSKGDFMSSSGDIRNYGALDGIEEAKALFAPMMGVSPKNVIVGGNSSLNMMYDSIARAYTHGVFGSEQPWGKLDCVKFLCPVPGYDRHFAITEHFGIEMIEIPMNNDGPDMDLVEKLIAEDASIKGIWCVPMYSNPQGITYSDEVVRRFASLKPAANDFRIFWDNAYCVHHLFDEPENQDKLLNIMDECSKNGTEDMVFIFGSTSKISFAGAGIAMMAASNHNLKLIKKQLSFQVISYDKMNQWQHVAYFKNHEGIVAHMHKHAAILRPKFDMVISTLERELNGLNIGEWVRPRGGYFVSFNSMEGCAKKIVALCEEGGVKLTGAGATYPYQKDAQDRNIRIAPTYPPVSELELAMNLFCLCVKLVAVETLLQTK